MPRARKPVAELPDDDDLLVKPEAVPDDPRPRAARGAGRPRKAAPRGAGSRGQIPARTPAGRIMTNAQMEAKVRAEVGMWLEMGAGAWEMVDPECASSLAIPMRNGADRVDTIADQVTAMIGRNKSVLAFAAKSGIISNAVMLLGALVPVGKAVYRAHGPGGHGHHMDTGVSGDFDSQYPAYTGAAAG